MNAFHRAALLGGAALLALGTAPVRAQVSPGDYGNTYALTTGGGEGDIQVFLDIFGGSSNGTYDPIGPVGSADVIFSSSVLLTQGDLLYDLSPNEGNGSFGGGFDGGEDDGDFDDDFDDGGFGGGTLLEDVSLISASGSELVSRFSVNQLRFDLTQTVLPTADEDGRIGSVLEQSFAITNLTDVPVSFGLQRYFDGDLSFDGTLIDGGGVILGGATPVLFETDATGDASDADTFVGITSTGGTVPAGAGYGLVRCCGVVSPLSNQVENDTDGDGFVDEPFDITLQTRNDFLVEVGQTVFYTTRTLFGQGVPTGAVVTVDGTSEDDPLLPTGGGSGGGSGGDGGGGFTFAVSLDIFEAFGIDPDSFLIDPSLITPTIFIDPVIATGYTYTVEGSDFASVTAPTVAAVNDADGYTLLVGGTAYALASGEEFVFSTVGLSGVQSFEITGIDTSLMLDPENPLAFVTGIAFTNVTSAALTVTQTPITFDTDDDGVMAPIPLPAGALLLGSALLGCGALRRRRART